MEEYQYKKDGILLKAENVSLSFGDNLILNNINVEVQNIKRPGIDQGQVIAFVGPSGIGKTQFSEIITGIKKPTSGRLLINKNPDDSNSSLQDVQLGDVGFVQQTYPLYKYLTVEGNLKDAAKKSGLSKADQKNNVEFYLSELNLSKHRSKYPKQLSGGQRQRVAIAQQLLTDNHFLILDEPFSGLDVIMIDKLSKVLNKVSLIHELNTIIVITHDINAAVNIADMVWVMGKEKDINGDFMPGAHILHQIDLIERGLAWRKDLMLLPAYSEITREIRKILLDQEEKPV